jgi:hypothetical protein
MCCLRLHHEAVCIVEVELQSFLTSALRGDEGQLYSPAGLGSLLSVQMYAVQNVYLALPLGGHSSRLSFCTKVCAASTHQ